MVGCGRAPALYFLQTGTRAKVHYLHEKENGSNIWWHVQTNRLKLLSMEVKDEGRVGGLASLAAGRVWRQKTRQD